MTQARRANHGSRGVRTGSPLLKIRALRAISAMVVAFLVSPAAQADAEQALIADLLRCARGQEPTETWRTPRLIEGHLKGNGRSANHGRMARAVQTCVAPTEKVGPSALTALDWWAAIEELERNDFGHRYQEIGGGYETWSGLSEAFVVAHTQDASHPAALMLERELLLFAIAARPIEDRSKWRTIYKGYGRRVAGLRKLPWAWPFTPDSYLYARILDLPIEVSPVRRLPEIELADAIASRVAKAYGDRLTLLRALALEPASAAGSLDELRSRAQFLRAVQPYVLVRQISSNNTFSGLLGPLKGRNTAPTRAVLTRGERVEQTEFVYPFLDDRGRPRRRVRGGSGLDSGGGELIRADSGALEFRSWNRIAQPMFLELPTWVPAVPPTLEAPRGAGQVDAPCGTVGIWLFPDREPVLWIEPTCEAEPEL